MPSSPLLRSIGRYLLRSLSGLGPFCLLFPSHDSSRLVPRGGPLPRRHLCCISPFGVCRILPRPMPFSFGSFCVLRVTFVPDGLSPTPHQKKMRTKTTTTFSRGFSGSRLHDCFSLIGPSSAWLLTTCHPVFVSPCHLVTEFLVALLRAVKFLLLHTGARSFHLSFALFPSPRPLLVCFDPSSLASAALVLLSFCPIPFSVLFFFLILCIPAPWKCSPAVFGGRLPSS